MKELLEALEQFLKERDEMAEKLWGKAFKALDDLEAALNEIEHYALEEKQTQIVENFQTDEIDDKWARKLRRSKMQ